MHRRRQYHRRALCKISKWLGKWNGCNEPRSLECNMSFAGKSYITSNSLCIMRSLAIRSLWTDMGSFLHQPRGNGDNHGREVIPFTYINTWSASDFTKSCVDNFVWRRLSLKTNKNRQSSGCLLKFSTVRLGPEMLTFDEFFVVSLNKLLHK